MIYALRQFGHADVTTTIDRYGHVAESVLRGAAKQRLPKRAAKEDVAMLVRVAHYDVACGRVERDEATVGR